MKKKKQKAFVCSGGLLAAFVLWTLAICYADVRAIGPRQTYVGLASLNGAFHRLTGVHMWLYTLTDWLSVIPLAFAAGFALLGLTQWVRRKHLAQVDRDLLLLGAFYAAVILFYLLFEAVPIHFRPVLIEGQLETSYPSSTAVLVSCVMQTAILPLRVRIRRQWLERCMTAAIHGFTVFMVAGRLLSGVHWLGDIIGGLLLSASLVMAYTALYPARKTIETE